VGEESEKEPDHSTSIPDVQRTGKELYRFQGLKNPKKEDHEGPTVIIITEGER